MKIELKCPLVGRLTFQLNAGIIAGVYVDLNRNSAPKEFHGLGLRIEDDILITETGVEVLTKYCPKTVSQIEGTMNSP